MLCDFVYTGNIYGRGGKGALSSDGEDDLETILSEKSGREMIEEEEASPAKKRKIEEGQLVYDCIAQISSVASDILLVNMYIYSFIPYFSRHVTF